LRLEQVFDSLSIVDLVGRWWNGDRNSATRRDIWLHRDPETGWLVRARAGDKERDVTWPAFDEEWAARAWVDRLMASSTGGRSIWKDLTKVVRKPPAGGWSARV
jgi:hypothetical protein